MTATQALAHLERLVESRLGALREGVQPLLDEVREHLAVLEPEAGGQRAAPKEQQQRQEKLAEVLEQVEDVLEALYLAVRARSPATGSRESRA